MDDIQKIIPITKVKKDFLDIVKEMDKEDSTIMVTKNGVAVGIIMTPNRYEALLETIEILGDPEIMQSLATAAGDFKTGRIYSHEDFWTK